MLVSDFVTGTKKECLITKLLSTIKGWIGEVLQHQNKPQWYQ